MKNLHVECLIALILVIFVVSVFFILPQPSSESSAASTEVMSQSVLSENEGPAEYQKKLTIDRKSEIDSVSLENSRNVRESMESSAQAQQAGTNWRITDGFDHPRPGVHVVCTPISVELIKEWTDLESAGEDIEPELLETYTDKKGCFDFPYLENGSYLVRADAPGWSPALGILDLSTERPDDFSAVMVEERVIRGKVLDCNKQPIKDALVYCYMTPDYPIESMPLEKAGEVMLFGQEVMANAKGEFEFKGLYPRRLYTLYIEYQGFMPVEKIVNITESGEQVLILKKSCVLEGRISGMNGENLPDATVIFYEPQSPYTPLVIENVDKDGRFRSEEVPEGFIHLVGSDESMGHTVLPMDIKPGTTNYAELKLPKGIKIKIKIVDENGSPLEKVRVTVESKDSGACLSSMATDETGEMVVSSLRKGDRNQIYARDLNRKYTIHNETYTFDEDSEVTIRMKKRFPIQLIVKDEATEEVISDYKVCVSSYYNSSVLQELVGLNSHSIEMEMKTECFDFMIAENEFFEIIVLADGYMPERVMALFITEEAIEPIEVFLKPGLGLKGRMVDSETHEPVPDALIQLYITGRYDKRPGFALSKYRTSTSNMDGTFSLEGMPEQRFFLKAKAPGYAPVVVDSLDLDLSAASEENRIPLTRGGSLSGSITSQAEGPLDQAIIEVRLPGTSERLTSRSESDGSYHLDGLPPGEHEVFVNDSMEVVRSGCKMVLRKDVIIERGKDTVADFSFAGTCTIRGLCLMDGGKASGILIHLYDAEGRRTRTIESSNSGYYRFSGLPHGKYVLEAHSTMIGTGGVIRLPVNLVGAQDKTIDLNFKGKVLCGTVTDNAGQPLQGAEIELLTCSYRRNYLTYTDHEGTYAVFNVEEGTYHIAARAPGCGEELKGPWMLGGKGRQTRKADFVLRPGGTARVHVKDSNGHPLANARVLLSNNMRQGVLWTGKTKYSGTVVFENLQTETLSAIAVCKKYAPASISFIAPPGEITDAEIRLVKGGSFKVEVRGVNGLPVSEANVTLADYSLQGLSPFRLVENDIITPSNSGFLTNEKGLFSLGLLPPGDFQLRISKGKRMIHVPLSVSSGQEKMTPVIWD